METSYHIVIYPVERPMGQGTEKEPPDNSQQGTEAFSTASCEELNTTNTHRRELGSRSFPRCLASYLYHSLRESLKQRTQLLQAQIPDPYKLWNNNYFCCQPLHLGWIVTQNKAKTKANKQNTWLVVISLPESTMTPLSLWPPSFWTWKYHFGLLGLCCLAFDYPEIQMIIIK